MTAYRSSKAYRNSEPYRGVHNAQGGVVFGGAVESSKILHPPPGAFGGIVFTGSAPPTRVLTAAMSGGIAFDGSAVAPFAISPSQMSPVIGTFP